MSGIERIAAERQRQIDAEGWTAYHDDKHEYGELLEAAACYLGVGDPVWPWQPESFRPVGNPIRNLEKAGALIAAEIDRLERRAADD
jgi:hypothetical protein